MTQPSIDPSHNTVRVDCAEPRFYFCRSCDACDCHDWEKLEETCKYA